MSLPQPSNLLTTNVKNGQLTDDESNFILTATLNSVHRKDGTILAFIDSFVRCKSISQSSEECGITSSLGYRIRHWKDVANAIQKLIDKSSIKYGFDNSEIFERVKEVVEFDPIMVQNQDGTFKSNMHDIAPEARRNIKKLKVKNLFSMEKDINGIDKKIIIGEVIEYDFYDKLKAAELTGREKDMFKNTTKVEHTLTKNMQDLLLESKKRADENVIDVTPAYKEIDYGKEM